MYINPFVCGIVFTILTELGLLIGYTIYDMNKKKNK